MLHDTRHFSASASFRAALATHPPGAPSILKRGPDPKYVEEEEIDVTLVPDAEADIHISDRAAEVSLPMFPQSPALNSVPATAIRRATSE